MESHVLESFPQFWKVFLYYFSDNSFPTILHDLFFYNTFYWNVESLPFFSYHFWNLSGRFSLLYLQAFLLHFYSNLIICLNVYVFWLFPFLITLCSCLIDANSYLSENINCYCFEEMSLFPQFFFFLLFVCFLLETFLSCLMNF